MSTRRVSRALPGLWSGVAWALKHEGGGGISRGRLVWRTVAATLAHRKDLRRWLSTVLELQERGLLADLRGEYLRALRPYVHRHTKVPARVGQLIDHLDWMETAFQPEAFAALTRGEPLVLAELHPPRGCEYMRLQLARSAPHSPEGELLLTLTLRRSSEVQRGAQPVDVAAVAFSRFRVDGKPCLVIGGVRGQRHPVMRLSPVELAQALHGWKPSVLMVCVMQELARWWNHHLVALNPSSHQLQGWSYQWKSRHRDAARRIYDSYDALWEHFGAQQGPLGWVVVPLHADDKLAATALSPEKRARQTRRADYWLRTRVLLREQFGRQLVRLAREHSLGRNTENLGPKTIQQDPTDFTDLRDDFGNSSQTSSVPSRALETGPGTLL
jgi:uncharacterized protein VirK/YbjX